MRLIRISSLQSRSVWSRSHPTISKPNMKSSLSPHSPHPQHSPLSSLTYSQPKTSIRSQTGLSLAESYSQKPNTVRYDRSDGKPLMASVRQISWKAKSESSDASPDSDLSENEDLFHEPPRVRFGMLKVALTIILGTYFGAVLAMSGANFLEEYEIFVKGEDDDED